MIKIEDCSRYLAEDIKKAWKNCLEIWKMYGRVEDLPRNITKPKYIPNFEKKLGIEFSKKFKTQYPFIIEKLSSSNSFEALCAFDILELILKELWICESSEIENLFKITLPLPLTIQKEISGLNHFKQHHKNMTVGHFFEQEIEDELS